MKILAWELDLWNSTSGSYLKYDKLEHFLLAFIGTIAGLWFFGVEHFFTLLIVGEILGIGWEIKDGFVPYNNDGNIQGFSWKDLIADNLGFVAGIVTWLIVLNFLWRF